MTKNNQPRPEKYDNAEVYIHDSVPTMAAAAAATAAEALAAAITKKGLARLIVGTGNSQAEFIDALMQKTSVDWARVEVFHMDEYVGISSDHTASFRRWLRLRVADRQKLFAVHYLDGDADDLTVEIARFTRLLKSSPIDVAFVGFGENGHIAFNDPPTADFNDPVAIKRVELDEGCRKQQVGEGHFKDIASMPTYALTLTCPMLFSAERWVCCVPDTRKAQAVKGALEGPIATTCPASLVRKHPSVIVHLDAAAASLLAPR